MNLILIAEDDPIDAFFLRHVFQECGITNRLEILSDGAAILSYLKGEGQFRDRKRFPMPVMLILDSRVGGDQVLDWLRTQPKHAFPIIMLTGMPSRAENQLAYEKEAQSFLRKPLAKADILTFMNNFKEIVGTVPLPSQAQAPRLSKS